MSTFQQLYMDYLVTIFKDFEIAGLCLRPLGRQNKHPLITPLT